MIPRSMRRSSPTAIAGSRVELIPKSGHIPQVEQMEATYTAVSAFLG